MGRAKAIQIRQNDCLQDQNFQNLQNFFSFRFIEPFKIIATYAFSWVHLSKIRLLHHK